METKKDMEAELRELLECSICTEIFNDPRQLPCIHTFCLKCLENLENNKNIDENLVCPLCRTNYESPVEGVGGFPRNFFIEKVKDAVTISSSKCDICEMKDSDTDASCELFYCIECKQRICGNCCKSSHNKYALFKNHQLVDMSNEGNYSKLVRKLDQNMCEDHESEIIKMFCSECKMAICAKCYIEGHKDHTCSSDINKICDEFREQLRKNTDTVSRCLNECFEIQQDMEDRNRRVLADVTTCETCITKSTTAFKEMIDKHEIELMTTLCDWRETEMTKIKERRLNIENHIAILESNSRYTKEVTDMGSTRDICRSFQELNTRADELKKTYDSYFQHHRELFSFSGITFSPTKFDDY